MKKTVSIVVLLLILLGILSYGANAATKEETYTLQCIENLKMCNIVENTEKWNSNSFITRREIFSIILDMKCKNNAAYRYDLDDIASIKSIITEMNERLHIIEDTYNDYLENPDINTDVLKSINTEEKRKALCYEFYVGHGDEFNYIDIREESEDYVFAFSLYMASILRGESREGVLYADFDEYATYEDAINTICRLFTHVYGKNSESSIAEQMNQKYQDDGHPLYHYADEIGLINSKNLADSHCPQIEFEQLDQRIPAYEFLVLLNRALYVPALCGGDYPPVEMFYYINNYR